MRNYEQYKRLMRLIFGICLIMIQVGAFWFVWRNFYSNYMDIPYQRKGHWLMAATYGVLIFGFAKVYGGWKIGYMKAFSLIYSQCLSVFFSNAILYLLITLLTKHFQSPIPLFLMGMIQIAIVIIWGMICTKIYQHIYPPRKVLLIYGERPIYSLMTKLNSRTDRFTIGETLKVTGDMSAIERKILQFQGVVICDIPSQERNKILKYCYSIGIRTYTIPKLSDIIIKSAESQHMFDTPLLLSRNTGITVEQRVIKRVIDIILSFIAIIITLPVMLLIAVVIKLQDGGTVIYKQTRLTQGGKKFNVYKFRSMREDSEKDGVARLACENDERITPFGKLIRAVRLDELPQLFNILFGNMSIVGPRPERPEIAGEYIKEIPEFDYRLKVKAGLTGYAQVYGKYNTTAYDKLKLDLMYIQNYSIRLDFEIMFKTVQILFMKESTEGVKEEDRASVLSKNTDI